MAAPHGYEEISGEVLIEKELAILFYDGAKKVWIPKSQIDDPSEFEIGKNFILLIPEWLAGEKGLI